MSDNLRVRLEFKRWSNPELRNSLLSIKKKETKNIKSLRQLIEKRFHLKQNFLLLIDGFTLESEETIDVVRDNDLIVIEPKLEVTLTKVKTEPKVKSEDKSDSITYSSYISDINKRINVLVKTEEKKKKPRIGPKSKMKALRQQTLSKEYVSSDSSDVEEVPKVFNTTAKHESKEKPFLKNKQKSIRTSSKTEDSKTKIKPEIKLEVKEEKKDLKVEEDVISFRNIPLRKAFKDANTSLKQKPQNINKTSSDTPKPKRKRGTKEALEPVDRFSPIIIMERHLTPNEDHSQENHMESVDIQKGMAQNRKQSARKSFPNPSQNTNNTKIEKNGKNEKELSPKQIDFDDCEPMTTIPDVGDIIAFKMLTLSANGNGYESSLFKMGSVLNVNKENQMIDVLLQDVIKRDNLKLLSKSDEQLFGIHSLKINWTTVLEPKLVQRQTDPELIVL